MDSPIKGETPEPSIRTVRKTKNGEVVFIYVGSEEQNIDAAKVRIRPPSKKKKKKNDDMKRPLPYPIQSFGPSIDSVAVNKEANFNPFVAQQEDNLRKILSQNLQRLNEIQHDLELRVAELEETRQLQDEEFQGLENKYNELAKNYDILLQKYKANLPTNEPKPILKKKLPIQIITTEEEQTYRFPYEACVNWDNFLRALKHAFPRFSSKIDHQRFLLYEFESGHSILPVHWEELIEPGLKYAVKFYKRNGLIVKNAKNGWW